MQFAGLLTDGGSAVQQQINEAFTGNQHQSGSSQGQGPFASGQQVYTRSPFDEVPTATTAKTTAPATGSGLTSATTTAATATAAASRPSSVSNTVPASTSRSSSSAPATAAAIVPGERRRQSLPHSAATVTTPVPPAAMRRMSTPDAATSTAPTVSAATAGDGTGGERVLTPTHAPPPVPARPPPADPSLAPLTRIVHLTTAVVKGELGIGLDLGKSRSGQGQVLRFKPFPPEVPNPASLCNPAIVVGDVIVGVNGLRCDSLSETVKIIRGTQGTVEITLEREVSI